MMALKIEHWLSTEIQIYYKSLSTDVLPADWKLLQYLRKVQKCQKQICI